jgi:hypothetical protein
VGEKIGPLLKELAPVCRGVAKDGCLRSITLEMGGFDRHAIDQEQRYNVTFVYAYIHTL